MMYSIHFSNQDLQRTSDMLSLLSESAYFMTHPLSPLDQLKREKLQSCKEAICLVESIWIWMKESFESVSSEEPTLHPILEDVFAKRANFNEAIATRIARKLSRRDMGRDEIEPIILDILQRNPAIVEDIAYDLWAIVDRDPACNGPLHAFLFFKGFHALTTYRIAHALWNENRHMIAFFFQNISSEVFGTDIHPAARIGHGILLDHATSFVVGETAIIENDVSILHEVTLGGTGKDTGNRHPIIRSGVLIGAGAKILGRVIVGECAKIGAGSVVLDDVPPHQTVVGVPATAVGETKEPMPALDMDQKCYRPL